MLEQEAQTLGLRDSWFPFSAIGSPQHLQILGFIPHPHSAAAVPLELQQAYHKTQAAPIVLLLSHPGSSWARKFWPNSGLPAKYFRS
jgi:hypothetical protein